MRFYWSAESRLDSLSVGGARIGFRYDARGRLVRRDSAGVAQRHFLWDGDNLLAELDSAGTAKVSEYSYYGMDRLHALVLDTTPYYGHQDVRGNTLALTTDTLAYGRYWYDAWGTATYAPGPGAPFFGADRARWKGALSFEGDAGLYYMRNRWYEPRTGRFLSEDPIGLAGGINPYLFAGDDPVNGSDPTGLCDVWLIRFRDYDGNGALDPGEEIERRCVAGGGTADGGGAGSGPGSRELARPAPSCGMAWLTAAGTVGGDALFFLGIGAAEKAGRLSVNLGRTAINIARQGGWRRVGRLAWQGMIVEREAANATRRGVVFGATSAVDATYTTTVQASQGGVDRSFAWRLADWIPVAASLKAIGEAAWCQWGPPDSNR